MSPKAITNIDIKGKLPKVASGKVRDLYAIDDETLLFVASDRISAYDVIMENGIPGKGALLTAMSIYWFDYLPTKVAGLQTHFLSSALPPAIADQTELQDRSMQVQKLRILPIESIVRGYITGSGWAEYTKAGTVNGIKMPEGLVEGQKLPQPLWTPSTKAEVGGKDENISPEKARALIGDAGIASKVEELSLAIYTAAAARAEEVGIILADTKFEFGVDAKGDVVLVDEVLTPDSSRFWPKDTWEQNLGKAQPSFDKQFLRDWLTSSGLKGKEGVEVPADIVERTAAKYREACEKLTGKA
ncbi:Bifunctional purine biosynthetic protein ade1 [Exserohilum turcicum]|uniref:Phosphoribosylaminoimidazole-succinocarboxamide synthase n=1 Tax=Exserohilum turcicum (strain 28A) TaxID=671987 RepID=R0I7B5_EXST2|nr:uncharacterized protein SETTUDRAFT_165915 [Exserohilum turcica Et28A]EOA81455.1 hypothetical protein SETTUDRAFT_165915 [Exserohilum turcica Et28A]